jgi:hypothetical protein
MAGSMHQPLPYNKFKYWTPNSLDICVDSDAESLLFFTCSKRSLRTAVARRAQLISEMRAGVAQLQTTNAELRCKARGLEYACEDAAAARGRDKAELLANKSFDLRVISGPPRVRNEASSPSVKRLPMEASDTGGGDSKNPSATPHTPASNAVLTPTSTLSHTPAIASPRASTITPTPPGPSTSSDDDTIVLIFHALDIHGAEVNLHAVNRHPVLGNAGQLVRYIPPHHLCRCCCCYSKWSGNLLPDMHIFPSISMRASRYACDDCLLSRRPCVRWLGRNEFVLLPLMEHFRRADARIGDDDYWVWDGVDRGEGLSVAGIPH